VGARNAPLRELFFLKRIWYKLAEGLKIMKGLLVLASSTLIAATSLILVTPLPTVVAQSRFFSRLVLPTGTPIAVRYPQSSTIRVPKGKTQSLTLEVAKPVRDSRGNVVIPLGSEVYGELRPVGQGLRFVAQELRIDGGEVYDLDALSGVVSRTSVEKKGASRTDILAGTVSGAGAATVIAGTTGDRRIDALEVLAGAALGTLAGWGLPEAGVIGGKDREVIVIEPARDLTLRLSEQLSFYP
jgi:hypothetical protein